MPLKTASANRKDLNTAANGVTLEHRHFAFIAGVIAGLPYEREITAIAFASACAETNPKFDCKRFLAACGVRS